ncbi:hypothetical protein [Streptomyces antibioticus]|uniref:hypothetical protein n=1 Tax=Streptomyces antibioticus TaxID=1890 RepID=UPI0033B1C00F
MSDEKRTPRESKWNLPNHEAGKDETWDRLGDEWRAVDGVIDGVRIYAKWTYRDDGRAYLSGLHVSDAPITADLLRAIPVGRLENIGTNVGKAFASLLDDLIPLRREKGEDPDAFAERVAGYYRMFSELSSKPAKMISVTSDVPLATVHGWIREARLRGKLPPGKRGKAG